VQMRRERAGAECQVIGVWGYLSFLIWAVVMAILAPGARGLLLLGLVVVFCAFFCAGSLRLVRRPEFWLLIASALLLSPFFIGEKDVTLWGLNLSRQGFWTGLWMTVRALSIALAFNGFASAVSVAEMSALFEGAGLKGLGFALGVAFNTLPTIQEIIGDSFTAMRLRGGFRRDRLGSLKKLLVTIVAGSLRRGEEIVDAAEARAFDPTRSQDVMAIPTRADVVLGISLLGCGLALVVPCSLQACEGLTLRSAAVLSDCGRRRERNAARSTTDASVLRRSARTP